MPGALAPGFVVAPPFNPGRPGAAGWGHALDALRRLDLHGGEHRQHAADRLACAAAEAMKPPTGWANVGRDITVPAPLWRQAGSLGMLKTPGNRSDELV